MKRKAVLIGTQGGWADSKFLPGVSKDVEAYKALLLSPVGGAWREDEIETLVDKRELAVRTAITGAGKADYSFVVFCGHGFEDTDTDSPHIELKERVFFDAGILDTKATLRTLILDSCRDLLSAREVALHLSLEAALFEATGTGLSALRCRAEFDRRLRLCKPGLVEIHSCAPGESAVDLSEGGLYSTKLLEAATSWADKARPHRFPDALGISAAHLAAVPEVKRLSKGKQNPTIRQSRSAHDVPFAVVA